MLVPLLASTLKPWHSTQVLLSRHSGGGQLLIRGKSSDLAPTHIWEIGRSTRKYVFDDCPGLQAITQARPDFGVRPGLTYSK